MSYANTKKKFDPSFESFEKWLFLHKSEGASEEERKNLERTIRINFFLEFSNIEQRRSFIADFDPTWQNPLAIPLKPPKKEVMDNRGTQNKHIEKTVEEIKDTKNFTFLLGFRHIPLLWMEATYEYINKILKADARIKKIHGNPPIYLCLHALEFQFDLDIIRNSFYSITGRGIMIGLVDSGIDTTHPDLAFQVSDKINVTNEEDGDFNGHGTFLAGILAGSGSASEDYYRGICPEAKLFDIKIFDEYGKAYLSELLLAMDLLLDRSKKNLPDILVFGFALAQEYKNGSFLDNCMEALRELGITLVAPAGNFGPDPGTLKGLGSFSSILSVGAVNSDNRVPFFSSRGKEASEHIKPDIVLPGTNIISTKALGGFLGESIAGASKYCSLSGTSISAAIAGGFIGLVKQVNPDARPLELIQMLRQNCAFLNNLPRSAQGWGIPNIKGVLKSQGKLKPKPTSFNNLVRASATLSVIFILILIVVFFLIRRF